MSQAREFVAAVLAGCDCDGGGCKAVAPVAFTDEELKEAVGAELAAQGITDLITVELVFKLVKLAADVATGKVSWLDALTDPTVQAIMQNVVQAVIDLIKKKLQPVTPVVPPVV